MSSDGGCAECPQDPDWTLARLLLVCILLLGVCGSVIWRRHLKKKKEAKNEKAAPNLEPLRMEELKQQMMLLFQ